MRKRITTLIRTSTMNILRLALLTSLATAAPLLATDTVAKNRSKLVQIVHEATRQYLDVNAAVAAGYGPFLGCISGPDHGAMGVHYVNGTLVGDGQIDATQPEALIYEPENGKMRLVGVEFIVDSATWLANNPGPPVLYGQSFLFVGSPNRYNIPSFFELHVWAWQDNPNGAYVDWNNLVSCEGE